MILDCDVAREILSTVRLNKTGDKVAFVNAHFIFPADS